MTRRVVVTRARGQAGALAELLRAHGFEPVEVPVIEITDPADGGAALRAAVAHLAGYAWIVVTSVNGAERLLAVAPPPWPCRVAAIGPGTAAALERAGVGVDVVPERFVGEALLDALPDPSRPGDRVLLARAAVARDVVPDGLRARGYAVDVVEAYRTVAPVLDDDARATVRSADAIAFTSPSTVHNAVAAFGREGLPPVVVSIGPVTSAACAEHRLAVTVEASVHTVAGLVDALAAHVRNRH